MDVLMPQLGETVTEGTVASWHKQVGDRVVADEVLLDVETDKASMEIPSPGAGVLTKILVAAGTTVDVGTVLAVIESGDAAKARADAGAASQPAKPAAARVPEEDTAPVTTIAAGPVAEIPRRSSHQRLSPAVRRLAAEHRLDLTAISGSGRDGRLTRRNVVEFLAARQSQPKPQPQPALQVVKTHAPAAAAASGNVLPFTRIRRLTAEHMVRSKATSPHVLQAVEIDFHRVDQVRKSVREAWKAKHGYSLTYLPFIAHAVCEALREFPNANASVEGDGLVLHEHVNLGIAIDLGPEGLVAPVIRSAEQMSVGELSTAINELAQRARSNRLKPDDFAGGTYTITNNGSFGTLITAPIINQPQVAILSTDGVRKKPIVIEGPDGDSIAIRPVGILAQSFDHRAIDGAYSGAFLNRVRKLLETGNWIVEV
ncbi:MAG TPA: dihydrolipoamide acetyltransferase family protein [Gammaproteobacteria bacterium]|nr:dihydrolipoamide acetyltransferase family protein [Gammaproteobacteria bacterium]